MNTKVSGPRKKVLKTVLEMCTTSGDSSEEDSMHNSDCEDKNCKTMVGKRRNDESRKTDAPLGSWFKRNFAGCLAMQTTKTKSIIP